MQAEITKIFERLNIHYVNRPQYLVEPSVNTNFLFNTTIHTLLTFECMIRINDSFKFVSNFTTVILAIDL